MQRGGVGEGEMGEEDVRAGEGVGGLGEFELIRIIPAFNTAVPSA